MYADKYVLTGISDSVRARCDPAAGLCHSDWGHLSLPAPYTHTGQLGICSWSPCYVVDMGFQQCQRKENTVPQFAPPVVRLDQEVSLRQPVYVPATPSRPRAHRLGRRGQREDAEGSSTESQADLDDIPEQLSRYVDNVVDAQYPEYVVIEASPRERGEEVQSTKEPFLKHCLSLY